MKLFSFAFPPDQKKDETAPKGHTSQRTVQYRLLYCQLKIERIELHLKFEKKTILLDPHLTPTPPQVYNGLLLHTHYSPFHIYIMVRPSTPITYSSLDI